MKIANVPADAVLFPVAHRVRCFPATLRRGQHALSAELWRAILCEVALRTSLRTSPDPQRRTLTPARRIPATANPLPKCSSRYRVRNRQPLRSGPRRRRPTTESIKCRWVAERFRCLPPGGVPVMVWRTSHERRPSVRPQPHNTSPLRVAARAPDTTLGTIPGPALILTGNVNGTDTGPGRGPDTRPRHAPAGTHPARHPGPGQDRHLLHLQAGSTRSGQRRCAVSHPAARRSTAQEWCQRPTTLRPVKCRRRPPHRDGDQPGGHAFWDRTVLRLLQQHSRAVYRSHLHRDL